MPQYITNLEVSTNPAEEQDLQAQGYLRIDSVLNKDSCGNAVYLWYKNQSDTAAITRIQVSYNEEMSKGLISAGFVKVYKSLIPGRSVFLWYFRGNTRFDIGLVKVEVTNNPEDEAQKMKLGWERVGINLRSTYESSVFLWVKRDKATYIYDVDATNSFGSDSDHFQEGYIRIDETTNTMRDTSSSNFLWYRVTKDAESALSDLQISTSNSQYQQYQQQKYTLLDVNLNEGAEGTRVYLWYKKEKTAVPVQSILLLLQRSAIKPYEKAGVRVIQENINNGNSDLLRYLCVLKKK